MASTSKKQSSLHSFFAKKGASKENGSQNNPPSSKSSPVSVANDDTSAPAKDGSGSSSLSKNVVPDTVRASVVSSPAATDAGLGPDDPPAKTISGLSSTEASNDEAKLNNKRQAELKELRRKKRRVVLDDDDSDDDDDDDEAVNSPSDRPKNKPNSGEIATIKEGDREASKPNESAGSPHVNLEADAGSSASSEAPAPSSVGKAAGADTSMSGSSAAVASAKSSSKRPRAEKIGADKALSQKNARPKTPPAAGAGSSSAKKALTSSSLAPTTQLAKVLKVKTDEQLLQEAKASWASDLADGQDLPYAVLCQTFSQIEAVSSRLQIQEILTNLFRTCLLLNVDLLPIVYLCCNEVAPAYKCVELGIGDAILVRAISEATGASPAAIKSQYEAQGDLGNVAQSAKGSQKTLGGFFKSKPTKGLTAVQVLQVFQQIATTKGNQSQKWKTDCIKKLLVAADGKNQETRYIIRGLQGKLRIGLAESTVLISLAHAVALTVPERVRLQPSEETSDADVPDEAKAYLDDSLAPEKRMEGAVAILKKAYSEVPSYEVLVKACLEVPLPQLHKVCTLTPGIPVAPMLAKPTKSVQEVLKRLNGVRFTCEYKYDGERAQVHLLPDGTTKVFSRNLLDTSEKYPEVPLFVKEAAVDVQSFVLDAEVVAFNNKTGQMVPFQVLSTRKKTEESAETAKVQVIVQAFDLMYLNGKSLLSSTLEARRSLLHQHFNAVPGKFQFATSMDHEENGDTTVIEEFLDSAVKGQCEGLMIKTLTSNANYEPSRRSLNWLKLKKDYLDGLGDSVDLVPLGAYFGRGKRTGVYGAYLLAAYDSETEELQSCCKLGTGFSDEDLKSLAEKLNQHIIPKKSSQYNTADQLECDVWFDAVQVWEVKAADLSKSSVHRCAEGKLEEGRGIGLRFPRFERVRDDKRPEDATTSDQILEMYYAQDSVADNGDAMDDGI